MKCKHFVLLLLLLMGAVSMSFGATLGTPTPTAPIGTITDTTPQFSWTAVTGAAYYRLSLRLASNTSVYIWEITTTNTSYTPSTPLNEGTSYKWYVRAERVVGDYGPWSLGKTFTVEESLGTPTGLSPTGTISDTTPTFNWTSVSGAYRYRLSLRLASNTSVYIWEITTTNTSYTHSTPLNGGTSYKWYVRAESASGAYGSWSTGKTFTLEENLGTPTGLSPSGTITDTTPTFNWTSVSGAYRYRLSLRLASNTSVYIWEVTTTSTSYTHSTVLERGTAYKWYVRAESASGTSGSWSLGKTFTVEENLGTPTGLSPSGTITDTTPTFNWTSVSGAYRYRLSLRLASNTSVYIWEVTTTSTNYTHSTPLSEGTSYTWYVRAESASGTCGSWSIGKTFTVEENLGRPTGLSPSGTITDTTPTFNWTSVSSAYRYRLSLRLASNTSVYIWEITTTNTSYTPSTPLTEGTCYKWYVRAESASGTCGSWSPGIEFCIHLPLPDLVVTDIQYTPSAPSAGEMTIIRATVENQGQAATPTGTPIVVNAKITGLWEDSFTVTGTSNQNKPLAVGESFTGTFDTGWQAIEGDHTLTVNVDPDKLISEISDNNNSRSDIISVPSNPFGFYEEVVTAEALEAAITTYKNGSEEFAEIVILNDLNLDNPLLIQEADNLLIRGRQTNSQWPLIRLTDTASEENPCVINVKGRVITNSTLRTTRITISDLRIQVPSGVEKRGVMIEGSRTSVEVPSEDGTGTTNEADVQSIKLSNVSILPPINDPPLPSYALWAGNAKNLVFDNVVIDSYIDPEHGLVEHYAGGIRIFNVNGFAVTNCDIKNIRHGFEEVVEPVCARRDSYALIVLNQGGEANFQGTSNGLIKDNTFERTSGQTIFFTDTTGQGLMNFVVENNNMTGVAFQPDACGKDCDDNIRDCGGRGIYPASGEYFLIKRNTLNTVGYGGFCGGINADRVSNLVIDDNDIIDAGGQLGPSSNVRNGYGISIRNQAWVKNNLIEDPTNNGVIVSEGATNVVLEDNTITGAGLYGIKINSGYYFEKPPKYSTLPWGPVNNVWLESNTFTKATGRGNEAVYMTGSPNLHPTLDPTANPPVEHLAEPEWNYYQVSIINNTFQNYPSPYVRGIGYEAIGFGDPLTNPKPLVYLYPEVDPAATSLFQQRIPYYNLDDDVEVTFTIPNIKPVLQSVEDHFADLIFPTATNTGAKKPNLQ